MQGRLFHLYVATVSGLGATVLAWGVHHDADMFSEDHPWLAIAIMSLGLVFGELFRVRIGRGSKASVATFSAGFGLALLVVAPLGYVLLVQLAALLIDELWDRRNVVRFLFNSGQYIITLAATAATFAAVSGQDHLTGRTISLRELVGLAVAGVVFVGMNFLLVGLVMALSSPCFTLSTVFRDWDVRLMPYGVDMCLAPLSLAMMHYSPWLLPLLITPTLIIRRSVRLASLREQEALHDVLTGLPNRALLHETFGELLDATDDGDGELAVMLIDLDHFKDINDTLGHHVGDLLLCEVARRLTSAVRPEDLVARLGGDEFAVLALLDAGEGRPAGTALAERLVRILDAPFYADDVRIDVRGSVGLALSPEHGNDRETLMSRADIALYQAKEARGCWAVYDPEADERSPEHLSLLGQLRDGIEADQIEVYYQPKIEVSSGTVIGVEALARWQHPERGLLAPDSFIPIAEATGLIVPLTLEVLDQALAQNRTWLDRGWQLSVAVNLSVRHLVDATLPAQVAKVLNRHDVPAHLLTLEVTESTVMSDPLQSAAVIKGLRALGLKVSLDDYGVGYCSLAYLCRLQVDELKIDRSLVANLHTSPSDALVVRSTIALAHDLGLRVVAEGIESLPTLLQLDEMSCDIAQGFHFTPPLPPTDFETWMDDRALATVASRTLTAAS